MNGPVEQHTHGDQSPNVQSAGGAVTITYNNSDTSLTTVIPNILAQFFSVVTGPRRFFASFRPDHQKALTQGLLFLVLCAAAGFLLRAPSYSGGQYWTQAIVTTVAYVPSALLLGAAAFLACRIVGGTGALRGHVTVFCYMAGVSTVAFALVVLAAQGVAMAGFGEHFALYREYLALVFVDPEAVRAERFAPLEQGRVLELSMGVLGVGTLLILGWLALAWRAMADLAGLSGGRVVASLAAFLVIGYGVNWLLSLAQLARGISPF